MSNKKTTEALETLICMSFVMQNMPAADLAEDRLSFSVGLQEIAKHIGDAHGMDWNDLVLSALNKIKAAMVENDSAEDLATSAILKAMGHKPH